MSKSLTVFYPSEVATFPENQLHPPDNIEGTCQQCGKCCLFYGCPLFDTDTNQCRIYENRPVGCRTWPHGQKEILEVGCDGFTQTGL